MDLLSIVKSINGVLWGYILILLLCGTGIYFTINLKFVQVRKFKETFKKAFGGVKIGSKAGKDGMSSFQAMTTAMAAQVGTGNLAGAATAIVAGGPGAIFWMWLSAFFGMGTIFAEAVLAQKFKQKVEGEIVGGPAYYISKGLGSKKLAAFFAVMSIIVFGFIGSMVQTNSISAAMSSNIVVRLIVGVIVAILAGMIFIGGVGRIAGFTEKVVPVMAVFYILGSLAIIIMNFKNLGQAFNMIFVGAFNPQAVAGGAVGITVKEVMRYGISRGLFSNEAGMGSTPHAHALAKVKHPAEQGLVAIICVFIDTFVILTLTALVILTTGAMDGKTTGIALTQKAFINGMGTAGGPFIAIALFFFAFSTIVAWYFFGETNVKYLFGKKALNKYRGLVLVFIVLGAALKVELVWELADTFYGLMIIPNLIALVGLGALVKKSLKNYEDGSQEKK
ncbi:sodium:alanine symporter family protein [Clostridium sp.]|uniref:alanine/glycine:cation symporter family protein n=1 Tax=Clostridium sp. TaxID=1506 RepID=UPI001A52A063|nr:sodium:alanine symporter family protein [Clostridium sp.]MBK5241364.1 sodium:alanine symporter family protein [Clostridium sp.]